ncbi:MULTISPECIES: hypothetical protein [unclassified Streptomyces]|uniref:hypothetical protein n=1 Tax=unclassified Streptomyces TaxID=2593676 RepID=UPI00131A2772|nr:MULTISPECIES: hypothetical protein [unclassified Streptomyces]MYT28953.1 hypothetical protein [Streptomyces sp. SID8354]
MVNKMDVNELHSAGLASLPLTRVKRLVGVYVVIALGTLAALAVMTSVAPSLATSEAWGHAVIVAVFAILLPLRTRAALKGSGSGLRAITIIGCVLLVVNLVEAALPGVFPGWMRVEMVVIAVMMLAVATQSIRARRNPSADHR